ncbi:hypothetical protein [Roseovarius phycicola]|uniref:Uncharacterized protein n=1 Tax=Roseovarius phycicola TaxID=3080976 RepID=A0ABZ2HJM5_9RHOB
MTKGSDRDTARRELVRLLEGLECYRSWKISCIDRDKGVVTEDDLNQVVMPSSFFLQVFDETKGSSSAAVIKEVQQWYSHTASDLRYMMNSGDEAWTADARQFLKDFPGEVGFDFYAEAGLLRKVADKALKSRKITNQGDYYSLRELENDVSQSVLSSEELAEISELLREFENNANVR